MKYQTKSVQVEAMQWKGVILTSVKDTKGFKKWVKDRTALSLARTYRGMLLIDNGDQLLGVHGGEWVIYCPESKLFSVCSNEDFKNKYKEIE